VKEFQLKHLKIYKNLTPKNLISEIPPAKKKSSFKLVVGSLPTPDWLQSEFIFFEFFADKKLSYWLDSSNFFFLQKKKKIFIFSRIIFLMAGFQSWGNVIGKKGMVIFQ